MRFYKKLYWRMHNTLREVHNTLVSPDVITFAIVSTVLVTIVYLI